MPTSKVDLTYAISRVAKGDRSAFEALYAATSAKLFGVAVRILVRRDLAEEVLQEVYLRVWQRAAEYDPALVRRLRGWWPSLATVPWTRSSASR